MWRQEAKESISDAEQSVHSPDWSGSVSVQSNVAVIKTHRVKRAFYELLAHHQEMVFKVHPHFWLLLILLTGFALLFVHLWNQLP